MNENEKILNRIKLLMSYDPTLTLNENKKVINIVEQPSERAIAAGRELLSAVENEKSLLNNVLNSYKRFGGIKTIDGVVLRNSDDIINAIKADKLSGAAIGTIKAQLLRSTGLGSELRTSIIDTFIKNPKVLSKYANFTDAEQIKNELIKLKYPEETADEMAKSIYSKNHPTTNPVNANPTTEPTVEPPITEIRSTVTEANIDDAINVWREDFPELFRKKYMWGMFGPEKRALRIKQIKDEALSEMNNKSLVEINKMIDERISTLRTQIISDKTISSGTKSSMLSYIGSFHGAYTILKRGLQVFVIWEIYKAYKWASGIWDKTSDVRGALQGIIPGVGGSSSGSSETPQTNSNPVTPQNKYTEPTGAKLDSIL